MNKSFLIFAAVIFSCHGGQKQKVSEKWRNGKNRVVLTYDNPNDTSVYLREFFFENGKLGAKGKIHNDKQDGIWEWWYDNGNKKDEAVIKDGMFIEQRKHWREDGTLKQVEIITGECLSDCCDGKVVFYDDKGFKLLEYTRKNGKWNGEGIGYFTDGKIERRFTYVDGKKQGINYEYYRNGVISAEGLYVDDNEEGKWTLRDSTGTVTGIQEYKKGKLISGE